MWPRKRGGRRRRSRPEKGEERRRRLSGEGIDFSSKGEKRSQAGIRGGNGIVD